MVPVKDFTVAALVPVILTPSTHAVFPLVILAAVAVALVWLAKLLAVILPDPLWYPAGIV